MAAGEDEWEFRPGRLAEDAQGHAEVEVLRALAAAGYRRRPSGRVGRVSGRPARTFHTRVSSLRYAERRPDGGRRRITYVARAGRPTTPAVDYVARAGNYHGRRADLEALVGDPDRLRAALAAVEAGVRVRRGPTREGVGVQLVLELPADSAPEQRRLVAEALVRLLEEKGHPALAAVHGCDVVQPHLHLLFTARPAALRDGAWVVDRTPARRILRHRQGVRDLRWEAAGLVNRLCRPAVRFWQGRDSTLQTRGIQGRPPRERIPWPLYAGWAGRGEPWPLRPASVAAAIRSFMAGPAAAAAPEPLRASAEVEEAVRRYLDALPAEHHEFGRRWASERFTRLRLDRRQLLEHAGLFELNNRGECEIYARPQSLHYVLIDDVAPEEIERARAEGVVPALVVRTSDASHAAWIRLDPGLRMDRETATEIARSLVRRYGGDPASADALHLSRLPGFRNWKRVRRRADGSAPTATIVEATGAVAPAGYQLHRDAVRALVLRDAAEAARRRETAALPAPDRPHGDPAEAYDGHVRRILADPRRRAPVDWSSVDYRAAVRMRCEGWTEGDVAEAIRLRTNAHRPPDRRKLVDGGRRPYPVRTAEAASADPAVAAARLRRARGGGPPPAGPAVPPPPDPRGIELDVPARRRDEALRAGAKEHDGRLYAAPGRFGLFPAAASSRLRAAAQARAAGDRVLPAAPPEAGQAAPAGGAGPARTPEAVPVVPPRPPADPRPGPAEPVPPPERARGGDPPPGTAPERAPRAGEDAATGARPPTPQERFLAAMRALDEAERRAAAEARDRPARAGPLPRTAGGGAPSAPPVVRTGAGEEPDAPPTRVPVTRRDREDPHRGVGSPADEARRPGVDPAPSAPAPAPRTAAKPRGKRTERRGGVER
jgi:hypothetical protein